MRSVVRAIALRRRIRPASRLRQHGAAAIEFALLFILFFMLFYALVSYSIAMMLRAALQHAAEEGARAAIAVDKLAYTSTADYENNGVTPRVRSTVGTSLAWLPAKAQSKVLGAGNANVGVAYSGTAPTVTVTVSYQGYTSDPLLPILTIPLVGPVPDLSDDLVGKAVIDL